MESINERIKELRIKQGVNQADVARSAGIKQSSYASIEKGDTKSITIEVGKGIAKALGVPFTALFDIEPSVDISDQLDKLKEENENLKDEVKEKQYVIDLLKNERTLIKLYLFLRLFGRYENAVRAIDIEISESQDEVEKVKLEKRKQFFDSEFTHDKNSYINQRIMTQLEFDEFFNDMNNVYTYLPSELRKQQ